MQTEDGGAHATAVAHARIRSTAVGQSEADSSAPSRSAPAPKATVRTQASRATCSEGHAFGAEDVDDPAMDGLGLLGGHQPSSDSRLVADEREQEALAAGARNASAAPGTMLTPSGSAR